LKCVKGNHDAAIIGDINIRAFNYEARASLEWLDKVITLENRRWLASLEEQIVLEDVTLVHGSPSSPVWEYIMDVHAARENMDSFNTLVCLVGHTHVPVLFSQEGEELKSTKRIPLPVDEPIEIQHKSILNPGSVGQPRDHDPRASYIIYDDEKNHWIHHRVSYDLEKVQKRILAAGLPNQHAYRLSKGW
jgi:diadenosine tetraphosphatase ApaH/serine/threonine PP2A family protein phosphatase